MGDVADINIGEFVIKTRQKDTSPYPVYNGGTSYTGFYDNYNNEANKIVISARGANAGYVNIVESKFWAGNSCYSLSITNTRRDDLHYVYQWLKYKQHLFTDFQQAANIPSVSKKDVEVFKIMSTILEEQEIIGKYFKMFDSLISLHQRQSNFIKNILSILERRSLYGARK